MSRLAPCASAPSTPMVSQSTAARDSVWNAGQGRPSYPKFSPDSALITYSRTTAGSRSTGNGQLWLAAIDGSFNKPLTAISRGNYEFYPSFAPRRAGGYYWLAFTSKRSYGNTNIDKAQIWMPRSRTRRARLSSRPAFYLRGQVATAKAYETNFSANACVDDGATCSTGADCCGGTCVRDHAEARRAPAARSRRVRASPKAIDARRAATAAVARKRASTVSVSAPRYSPMSRASMAPRSGREIDGR